MAEGPWKHLELPRTSHDQPRALATCKAPEMNGKGKKKRLKEQRNEGEKGMNSVQERKP